MVFKKRSPALFLMTQILSTVYETETVGTGTETNNNNRERVNSTRVSRDVSTQCQGAIASRKCTSKMFQSYFIRTVQIFSFR